MSLGDKFKKLQDEHGDRINEVVDDAQAKHSDRLGQHQDTANKLIDQAQDKFLKNDPQKPDA